MTTASAASQRSLLREGDRAMFEKWLLELTQIPTAAGHEHRVVEWIERFVDGHETLVLERDAAGNLVVSLRTGSDAGAGALARAIEQRQSAKQVASLAGKASAAAANLQQLQQVAAQKLAALPAKLSGALGKDAKDGMAATASAAQAAADALGSLAASLTAASAQSHLPSASAGNGNYQGSLAQALSHAASDGAASSQPERPLYITAHLDHPAFVVERVIAPTIVELSFRGGVMAEYFTDARVVLHGMRDEKDVDASTPAWTKGTLTGLGDSPDPRFKRYICELDGKANMLTWVKPGDIGVWDVGPARIEGGKVYTLACDDLSAAAAALSAMHVIARAALTDMTIAQRLSHVRLLLTRAEEIGFVGAIAACRLGTMEQDARVIALENSRSFPESPIHGGVIVRVGDRVSVFSPTLVDAVAQRAADIAGGASTVTASQKLAELPSWKWQRKLMAGGACEASVYCAYGYESMCVCLPLGNYHNMTRLDEAQAGTLTRHEIGHEFIGVDDYHSMIDLLLACAQSLPERSSFVGRLDDLWSKLSGVLSERA
jgi:endoglucanase